MFLAEVTGKRGADILPTMPDETKLSTRRQIFTMVVVESFNARRKIGDVVEVQTGSGGGDCGYSFHVGGRYVVDAFLQEGTLSTSICSQTAPEVSAAVLLHELRALSSNKRLPDISGAVIRYPARSPALKDSGAIPRPVPDVPVTLLGEHGETVRSTTGPDGVYEVPLLAAGNYTVSFDLAAGLTEISDPKLHSTFIMPAPTATGAACHVGLDVWSTESSNESHD